LPPEAGWCILAGRMTSEFFLGIGDRLYGIRMNQPYPGTPLPGHSPQLRSLQSRFTIEHPAFSAKVLRASGSQAPLARIEPAGHGSLLPGGMDWLAVEALFADERFWESLDGDDASRLELLAANIRDELTSGGPGADALAGAYALQFVILSLRLRTIFLTSARPWKEPEGVWSVDDAKRYIEVNYAESFSLDWFVGKCAMNTTDFSRRFKDNAGCPLFEFINRQRVSRACALLKSSGMSIIEIAEAVGYNNLSFFNRYFLRIVGLSPRAYRSSPNPAR